MKLTQEQQDIITEFAEDNDIKVYEQYSGRGMYGSKCFGLVGDDPVKMAMGLAVRLACDDNMELANRLSDCVRYDNMGLDSIVYFTRAEWNEEDAEEVDTDEDEDGKENIGNLETVVEKK